VLPLASHALVALPTVLPVPLVLDNMLAVVLAYLVLTLAIPVIALQVHAPLATPL
jgi:hypothetical protein